MLRRFLYLQREALGQYLAALEGGRVTSSSKRTLRGQSGSGGVDARVVQATRAGATEDEHAQELVDTDEARFERLQQAADADPESLGWWTVGDPESDFPQVGIGAMVEWECDLYVPDFVKTFSRSGGAREAIELLQTFRPMADQFGLETEGLPRDDELIAMSSLLGTMEASTVVVGEDDDTGWRIAGQLEDGFVHGDVEGRARVVGKVTRRIAEGRWKPLLALPGMRLISREERRRLERQGPKDGEEDQFLAGPALMLDILAIFR